METIEQIEAKIACFLTNIKQPILSEAQLQVMLALHLKQIAKYDEVYAEYTFPKSYLGTEYQWGKKNDKVSFDIVVRKGEEYYPIELKYKTKEENTGLKLFGCETEEIKLAEQAAKNLNCYGFWKDVKRLELIKDKFAKVSGGIALFVTNADTYLKKPEKGSQYARFSIYDGRKVKANESLYWVNPDGSELKKDDYRGFNNSNDYELKWQECGSDKHKLHYLILSI